MTPEEPAKKRTYRIMLPRSGRYAPLGEPFSATFRHGVLRAEHEFKRREEREEIQLWDHTTGKTVSRLKRLTK